MGFIFCVIGIVIIYAAIKAFSSLLSSENPEERKNARNSLIFLVLLLDAALLVSGQILFSIIVLGIVCLLVNSFKKNE